MRRIIQEPHSLFHGTASPARASALPNAGPAADKPRRVCKIEFLAAMLLCAVAAGCATMSRVDLVKPVEYVIDVQADELWQNSGVYARRGQLIQVSAKGEWGDRDGMFGPEGNPKAYKTHLGVNAPAYGLLMMLSTETNKAYFAGSETSIHAPRSGHIMFRSNLSLAHRATGRMTVFLRVATDTDGDGVPDYDEVFIWDTDPLNPDTNGLGFGDLHKIEQMKKALPEKEDSE